MADIQLNIVLSGLYSLSRGTPVDPAAPSTDVLLVDARKSRQKGLPRHVPRLTVDLRYLERGSSPADTVVTLADGSSYAVWHLEGMDVGLPGADEPLSLASLDAIRGDLGAPGSDAERKDLHWVPSLSRIIGRTAVDPAVLGPKPPAIVGARVFLRHGTLSTERLATTRKGEIVEFPFVAAGEDVAIAPVKQALASAVRWRDELRSAAEIQLVPFGASKPRARVILQPINEPDVTVTITNEPVLLGHQHGEDEALLLHWSALYDVTLAPPKPGLRRLPRQGIDRSAGGTHCPPDQLP